MLLIARTLDVVDGRRTSQGKAMPTRKKGKKNNAVVFYVGEQCIDGDATQVEASTRERACVL
ncbi:hypothetical protein AOQ73_40615 [Bradyrhizobium pachyrhizi]|nr:hypothetical protein AOQ73_40615 [Bradyrhizobium pachyrhizi]